MDTKAVYIAGKVTGEQPEEVIAKFKKAQLRLEARGHQVINPVEVVGQWAFDNGLQWHDVPWHTAMRLCIKAMMNNAGRMYMLSCWRFSTGATVEHNLALNLSMPVEYEHE